ncbi:MAG: TnpV protein [Eubacteriales bacterium]|nr:TnpV protein [Eubacteriales bacterium]
MFGKLSITNPQFINSLDELLALVSNKVDSNITIENLYFGQVWKKYLIENNKEKVTNMIINGTLSNKIKEVDKIANIYKDYIFSNLSKGKININLLENIADELTIKNVIEKIKL